jgi:hypothetical protein
VLLPIDRGSLIRIGYRISFECVGHGGRQIVDFLEETLENNIAIELKYPDDAPISERLTRCNFYPYG